MENNNKPSSNQEPSAQPKAPAAITVSEPQHTKANRHRTDSSKKWEIGLLIGTLLAAGTAAYYTRQQWITADDQERRSLRAYVFVDKASVVLDGRTFKSEVDLKNTGQTPAYDVAVISHLETRNVGETFAPRPFQPTELHKEIMAPQIITNPYVELEVPVDNTTVIPGMQSIPASVTLYLVGRVAYRDAFNRKWILDFRFQTFARAGNHWIMQPTEDGNEEVEKK